MAFARAEPSTIAKSQVPIVVHRTGERPGRGVIQIFNDRRQKIGGDSVGIYSI